MIEVLQESIALVNLPYTILLVVMFGYWLLYILGFLGSEALDFLNVDLDVDANVDLDLHAHMDAGVDLDIPSHGHGMDLDGGGHGHDVDLDVGGHGHGGALVSCLKFFHVGDLPVMIILSFVILWAWVISMMVNHYLPPGWSFGGGVVTLLLIAAPIFICSLAVTKLLLMPFAPYLKQVFDTRGDRVEVLGKSCRIHSLEVTPKHGQAEFATEKGAPLILNVKTKEGETLKKGDEALIYKHDKENNIYFVTKLT